MPIKLFRVIVRSLGVLFLIQCFLLRQFNTFLVLFGLLVVRLNVILILFLVVLFVFRRLVGFRSILFIRCP